MLSELHQIFSLQGPFFSQFQRLSEGSVVLGADVVFGLECLGEDQGVPVARVLGDFLDGHFGIDQKKGGPVQLVVHQEILYGGIVDLMEEAV